MRRGRRGPRPCRPTFSTCSSVRTAESSSVIALLAWGVDPDPVDPCGASPLWYAVRSLSGGIAVALIEAGADAGRRVELSARGETFTTILHEIVRLGRTVALSHALAKGVDPLASRLRRCHFPARRR